MHRDTEACLVRSPDTARDLFQHRDPEAKDLLKSQTLRVWSFSKPTEVQKRD